LNITIRTATEADAIVVVDLVQQLAESSPDDSPLDSNYVREYIKSGKGRILIAEADGVAIGMASFFIRPNLYHAGNSCFIDELVVADGHRRQGIGGALMAKLIEIAEAEHCAEITVCVDSDNDPAIKLYNRFGLVNESLLLERHY
jgi:ribosomal protein S18 acetylase RimI-like enzyme